MFFLPGKTQHVIRDIFLELIVFSSLAVCLLFLVPVSHAQDDFSDPNSHSYDSYGEGGYYSEGSYDSAVDGGSGGSGGGQDVSQDTGSFDGSGGGDGGDSLSDLAGAAAQEMVDCGCWDGPAVAAYNAAMDSYIADVAPQAALQNEITDALVNAPEGMSIQDALSGISVDPSLGMDQVSAALGGALNGEAQIAGEIAQDWAQDRGEGVGTQMGSFQIAYSTAGGESVTGDQITQAAIAAVEGSLDKSDPDQSKNFAGAAFSTANTHNVDPASVAQQLTNMDVSASAIEQAAQDKGVADRIGNPVAPAAHAQAASTGPAAPQVEPAPAPAPASAPEPVQVAGPPPAPPPAAPAPAGGNESEQNSISIAQPTEGSVTGRDEPTTQGFVDRVYSANFPITDNATGQAVGNVAVNARDVDNRFDPTGARDEVTVTVNNWGGSNTTVSVPLDQVITNGNIDPGKVDRIAEQHR